MIPTLTYLLKLRSTFRAVRKEDAKILLAAVSTPFKWSIIPHAVEEVESIRNMLPDHITDQAFTDASSQDILGRLPECSILHLACHGYQDQQHPLNSGFVMHDQMLTVSQLMAINLPDAFMAFLSACETAKGDQNQPDQAIHLAATMLFVGFKSVVGTMWLVIRFDLFRN